MKKSLFKLFWSAKPSEDDIKKEKECILRIKQSVSKKCNVDKFIDYDDFTVAFAGSKDDMKLILEICTQNSKNQKYLYASVDDEVSWQSCDFDSISDFEENIAKYIANRVNKTVKTVTDINKHKLSVTSYYLNDNGEWSCFEDECPDSIRLGFIASKIVKPTETINTYNLEI